MDKSVQDEILKLHAEGMSVRGIASHLHIPKSSVQDIISNSATKGDENGDDGKDVSDVEHNEAPEFSSVVPRARAIDLNDEAKTAISRTAVAESESRTRVIELSEETRLLERQSLALERIAKARDAELKTLLTQAKISNQSDGDNKLSVEIESLRAELARVRDEASKKDQEYQRSLLNLRIEKLESAIASLSDNLGKSRDGKTEYDLLSQGMSGITSELKELRANAFAFIESSSPQWQAAHAPGRRGVAERQMMIGGMVDKIEAVELLRSKGLSDDEISSVLGSHQAVQGSVVVKPAPAQPGPSQSELYQRTHELFQKLMALGIARDTCSQICDRGMPQVSRKELIVKVIPADQVDSISNECQALFGEPFVPPAASSSRGNL